MKLGRDKEAVQKLRDQVDSCHAETSKLTIQIGELRTILSKIDIGVVLNKAMEEYDKLGILRSQTELVNKQATDMFINVGSQLYSFGQRIDKIRADTTDQWSSLTKRVHDLEEEAGIG